jgi:hypothetical protein
MRRLLPVLLLAACGGGGSGPNFATDHPRIYIANNKDRLKAALAAGEPAAVAFQTSVDEQLGGANLYNFQASDAALMGQLTGDAKYCQYAVQQTDTTVNAELALINGGQAPMVAGDDYLQVGPVVGDIMLTYDWCFDAASDDQKTHWLDFAAQAVDNVWNPDSASWGGNAMPWNGWAIDDPNDNYYYSFLRATELFGLAAHGEQSDADAALDQFRTTKIANELMPKFTSDLTGGGSREGTGYGVSMHDLWDLYDFWQASTGENIADLTPHTHSSLLYWMHAVMPTRDYMAPIGDHARDSTAAFFDYDRDYIQELAFRYSNDPVAAKARWLIDNSSIPQMSQHFMQSKDFLYTPTVDAVPLDGLGTAYYASGNGDVFARSDWSTGATWVSLKAGPYTESHAHRDQGSFLMYKNGWLAYDPNYDSHSGLRQEEEAHNLVRLSDNGTTVQQQTGTTSTVTGLHQGTGYVDVSVDTAPAYGGDSRVSTDKREMVFVQPDVIVVYDHVASTVSQIWTINTPTQPTVAGARTTTSGLEVDRLAPTSAQATVVHWPDVDSDYSDGYRVDETVPAGDNQMVHVVAATGAITSATGTATTANLSLADGRTVSIDFGAETMDLNGTSVTLGPGVDTLAE